MLGTPMRCLWLLVAILSVVCCQNPVWQHHKRRLLAQLVYLGEGMNALAYHFRKSVLRYGPEACTGITGTLIITNVLGRDRQPMPLASDTVFVADQGHRFDQYVYGDELLPSGLLTFTVPISRVFSPWMTTGASGIIGTQWLPTDWRISTHLLDLRVLPLTATLALAVFDIDDKPMQGCAEVDKVLINGFSTLTSTAASGTSNQLSGGQDNGWTTWSATVPITALKFATYVATGVPTPALQNITIDVATTCRDKRALAVDWAAITIDTPILPLVIVHGFTGDSRDTIELDSNARSDGIPSLNESNYVGVINISDTAKTLAANINTFADQFGVQKVDVFAHSAGGIASRQMLAFDAAARARVRTLVTFGTPHHGWDWAMAFGQLNIPIDLLDFVGRCYKNYSGAQQTDCVNTSIQLSRAGMCRYNYTDCEFVAVGDVGGHTATKASATSPALAQPGIRYRSLVGYGDPWGFLPWGDVGELSATYPWNADTAPFPATSKVDVRFKDFGGRSQHYEIVQQRAGYLCAMWLVAPTGFMCPSGNITSPVASGRGGVLARLAENRLVIRPNQATLPAANQVVASRGITLAGNTTFSLSVPINAGSSASFLAVSSAPVSFTLRAPSGRVITRPTARPGSRQPGR